MRNCHPCISWVVVVVCLGSATEPYPYCSQGSCEEGQKMDTNGYCVQCDKGTFMPFKGHACSTCFSCTNVTSPDEIIVSPCTDRVDTQIVCREGYFTAGQNTPTTRSCTKCGECTQDEYMWRNCTATKDTGCRPTTTTTEAVMNDESTRTELNTTEIANMVTETSVSPSSKNTTTEGKTNSYTVMNGELTTLKNYLNSPETANMVNETAGSPSSINTITVLLEGNTNNYTYFVIVVVLSVIVIILFLLLSIVYGASFRDQIRNCFLCKRKTGNYEVEEVSSATRQIDKPEMVTLINLNHDYCESWA